VAHRSDFGVLADMSNHPSLAQVGKAKWSMGYITRQLIQGPDAPDVSAPGGMFTSFNHPLFPIEALWHPDISILLGDPGAGKTSAIHHELEKNENVRYHDLAGYEEPGQLERLFAEGTFSGGMPERPTLVVLDSFDECRFGIKTLPDLLVREISKLPADRSWRLCIACRHAEWEFDVETKLRGAARTLELFQLAPLGWEEIMAQAKKAGVDGDALFDFVRTNDLTPFVVRPVTLEPLLRSLREESTQVPKKEDLFEEQCERLCAEWNAHRRSHAPRPLSDAELLDLASRVAALLHLTNRLYVCTDPAHAVRLECLAEGMMLATETLPWRTPPTLPEFWESLKVAIFTRPQNDHVKVREASVRDFLAARWLLKSGFELAQVIDLVMHSIPGAPPKVRPQLRAMVGWLVGRLPGLADALIEGNVDVVLRADLRDLPDDTKSRVVAELLRNWASNEHGVIPSEWRLETLSHVDLAPQLEEFLTDPRATRLGRRLALRLGRDCRVSDLVPTALAIALDGTQSANVRAEAIRTIAAFGQPASMTELVGLLRSDFSDGPGQPVRDALMRTLWPDHVDAQTLFGAVRRPDEVISHYHSFLSSTLMKDLRDEDLPPALDWVDQLLEVYHVEHTTAKLFELILHRAWEAAGTPGLMPRLARTVIRRMELHDFHHSSSPLRELWLTHQQTRQALLQEIAGQMTATAAVEAGIWSCGHPDDLDWLLAQLAKSRGGGPVEFWSQLILGTFRIDRPEAAPAVYEATEAVPELRKAVGHWFEAIPLDGPIADQMRQELAFTRAREERPAVPARPSHSQDFREALTTDTPLADLWYRYFWIPAGETRPEQQEPTSEDIWDDLAEVDRQRLVAGAAAFLQSFNPMPGGRLKHNTYTLGERAGVQALRFLMAKAPESMPNEGATIARWRFPAVRASGSLDEASEKELVNLLVWFREQDGDGLRRDIRLQFGRESKAGHIWVLSRLARVWDYKLQSELLAFVGNPRHPLAGFAALLADLIPRGVAEARQLAFDSFESLLDSPRSSPTRLRRGVVAGRLLLKQDLLATWPKVKDLMLLRPPAAHALFDDLAVSLRDNIDLSGLSEGELSELYRFLFVEQPLLILDGRDDATQIARSDFRDQPLAVLQGRGNAVGYQALKALADEYPQSPRLASIAENAADVWASRAWRPPPPATILGMADDPVRRSVTSADRLADTVAASLRSWNEHIEAAPPTVFTLWDRRPNGSVVPKEEEALSDVLAKHLNIDLRSRISVAREDQLSRLVAERVGESADLIVKAPDASGSGPEYVLVVEVKGVWNPGLIKDLRGQLVDRYMHRLQTPVGLYVVGNFDSPKWTSGAKKRQADRHRRQGARRALLEQAAAIAAELRVTVVWLDLELP
jgi:hypothetical protein